MKKKSLIQHILENSIKKKRSNNTYIEVEIVDHSEIVNTYIKLEDDTLLQKPDELEIKELYSNLECIKKENSFLNNNLKESNIRTESYKSQINNLQIKVETLNILLKDVKARNKALASENTRLKRNKTTMLHYILNNIDLLKDSEVKIIDKIYNEIQKMKNQ